MKALLRPLLRYLLLLCVLLNLGDAPYVDEQMAEMGQDAVFVIGALAADTAADASKASTNPPAKAKRSIYDNLLANVALPTQEQTPLAFGEPDDVIPAMALGHPPSGPPSSIDKPPRTELAA
ncbi:hypothetical protein GCM10010975_37410 [Comamonas phosphati]|nr:hypothetical protein GCM10010975_37410 [Comamonas phosphati]